jgi:hypothetical protein
MSECLSNDIDDYLAAAVLADMGAGSSYATLKVLQVEIDDFIKPALSWTPPLVFVSNAADEVPEAGPHGDGIVHARMLYKCALSAIVRESTKADARRNAKILQGRLKTLALARFALGGLAATTGERVIMTTIAGGETYVFPVEGASTQWWGVGVVALDVHSQI